LNKAPVQAPKGSFPNKTVTSVDATVVVVVVVEVVVVVVAQLQGVTPYTILIITASTGVIAEPFVGTHIFST